MSANTQHPLHELSHLNFTTRLCSKHYYPIVSIPWGVKLRLRVVRSFDQSQSEAKLPNSQANVLNRQHLSDLFVCLCPWAQLPGALLRTGPGT